MYTINPKHHSCVSGPHDKENKAGVGVTNADRETDHATPSVTIGRVT